VYLSGPPELKQAADARVFQARSALDLARNRLAQATLTAPYDGTVVTVAREVGEWADPAVPIIRIADLSGFRVETIDLSERDLQGIYIGQPVTIQIDALGRSIPGNIAEISPMGLMTGADVIYQVIVTPKATLTGFRWGMSATVYFQTP
jgi:HlyD family secretion protein